MIEEGVGGKRNKAREIECAVLGNDDPKASVAGEIVPCKEFYDYDAKYLAEGSELVIPAKLTKAEMKNVQTLAIKAFQAVDCSGLARVDFLMEPKSRKIYVNEINTMPGFTAISMYPKLWAASGVSYHDLIGRLIQLGIERHEEKKKNQFGGSEFAHSEGSIVRRFAQAAQTARAKSARAHLSCLPFGCRNPGNHFNV